MDGSPADPVALGSTTVRALDRGQARDRAFIEAFLASCPAADLDEAERGRGLRATSAARSAQGAGRFPLYNCDDTNVGSGRLVESVGFTVAQQVAAARFNGGGPPLRMTR
ncbi:MAG: hypothetical protein WA991_00040 [Ornithinimicrobium sp.]